MLNLYVYTRLRLSKRCRKGIPAIADAMISFLQKNKDKTNQHPSRSDFCCAEQEGLKNRCSHGKAMRSKLDAKSL
ncbi:hypothetical protein BKA81DRAFT_374079 [Phyllosticta paracitricarpa]